MRLIDRLKAAAQARQAVPLFPIGYFTEQSQSAFVGTPPPYTRLVCMVTHRTGAQMEAVARCDDRGQRPEEEQDQRPPAKFRPRGKPSCEQSSRARGAAKGSTRGGSTHRES